MPMTCCAYGCSQRFDKNKDIHFYGFPLHKKDLLQKWINAVKRKGFKPSKYSKVCSDHFRCTDFLIQPGFKYKRLKDDAVPSIFEEFDKHLKKKPVPKRTTKTSVIAETEGYPQFEESVMESENYRDIQTDIISVELTECLHEFEESVTESENHRDIPIQTDITSVESTERVHNLQYNVDSLINQVDRQQGTIIRLQEPVKSPGEEVKQSQNFSNYLEGSARRNANEDEMNHCEVTDGVSNENDTVPLCP